MALKRKQIYLDRTNDRRIRSLARATGLSEAEHIRRAVGSYVAAMPGREPGRNPLLGMIGLCDSPRGPNDAAVDHDKYLYGRDR